MSPEWPLFLPIPDIMKHTHSWGTSGRILYTHTCRQHVLDVRTCSQGHVHQDDSNPWWSFRGTFMQNGPLLETQMDLQKSDFQFFFSEVVEISFRSIQIRALFALTTSTTGSCKDRACKDGAGSPLSLSSLSDFSSLTFLSFLAHISLLHAQKSSRHNTRRVFYILH